MRRIAFVRIKRVYSGDKVYRYPYFVTRIKRDGKVYSIHIGRPERDTDDLVESFKDGVRQAGLPVLDRHVKSVRNDIIRQKEKQGENWQEWAETDRGKPLTY